MATLVLNAGTTSPINLVVQTADENQPTEIGSVTQSFNGADRSSVRAVKRNYGSLISYLDTTSKDAVINLLKNGAQLPCSGDLLANIQTQCTVRYTGARMAQGTATGLWKVGLTLSEVQPNVTLLRYAPGDTITGATFARSTTARYYDANGVVQSAAIDTKRDGHYIGGVRSLLLEDTRTNLLLRSQELDNAAWTAVATVTANSTNGPDGTATAETVNDTSGAATQDVHQNITIANDSATRTISIFLKANTSSIVGLSLIFSGGTGLTYGIVVNLATGATLTQTGATAPSRVAVTALANSWYRVAISGANNSTGNTTLALYCYPAWNSSFLASFSNAATGSVYAWGAQCELGAFASSYITTTTSAVPRGADFFSLPFTPPPQEMSVYSKFVELGTAQTANAQLFGIENVAAAGPNFVVYAPSGAYVVAHSNGSVSVTGALGASPAFNDIVELEARLFGDGSVDATQSLNSAAATASAQSAANALATAWSGPLCWLNSAGNPAVGFVAIQSFKIVAGMRSLAEMRAA